MKSKSWNDEFEEQILQNFGSCKDPPIKESAEEQKRSEIKKAIREGIKNNQLLSQVLKENKAEGKFIKEVTNHSMNRKNAVPFIIRGIELQMSSYEPINMSLTWDSTSQGYHYWHRLNNIYRELRGKQLSK